MLEYTYLAGGIKHLKTLCINELILINVCAYRPTTWT